MPPKIKMSKKKLLEIPEGAVEKLKYFADIGYGKTPRFMGRRSATCDNTTLSLEEQDALQATVTGEEKRVAFATFGRFINEES